MYMQLDGDSSNNRGHEAVEGIINISHTNGTANTSSMVVLSSTPSSPSLKPPTLTAPHVYRQNHFDIDCLIFCSTGRVSSTL